MKRLPALVIAALFMCNLAVLAQARENEKPGVKGEEQHHAISAAHTGAMENTRTLKERLTAEEAGKKGIDKAAAMRDMEKIRALMADAKAGYIKLKEVMGDDEKKFDSDIRKMEERLARADEHLKALEDEMMKQKPGREKMKQSSEGVIREVKSSEDKNREIMKKRGVKPPEDGSRERWDGK